MNNLSMPAAANPFDLALKSYQDGKFMAAQEACFAALQAEPSNCEPLILLGMIARRSDDPELAIDLLRQAIEVQPGHAIAHSNLGAAFYDLGRHDEAIEAWRNSVTLDPAAIQIFNRLAMVLRLQGELSDAAEIYFEALKHHPHQVALWVNYAVVLEEAGEFEKAAETYHHCFAIDPDHTPAWSGLASLCARHGKVDDAVDAYRRLLLLTPEDSDAWLALSVLLLAGHQRQEGLAAQAEALARKQLYSTLSLNQPALRDILILAAPGDFSANIPTGFLLSNTRQNIHTYYILNDAALRQADELPAYDVVLNAIAECGSNQDLLTQAAAFLKSQAKPSLNDPQRVKNLGRDNVAEHLANLAGIIVPRTVRAERSKLSAHAIEDYLAAAKLDWPVLIRPEGSHGGHGLELVGSAPDLTNYLSTSDHQLFYLTQYYDYQSQDGYFRKYRLFMIGDQMYPCHLAISPHWMVHYYSSGMSDDATRRAEEAAFLQNPDAHFGASQRDALAKLANAIGLDYLGLDCTLVPNGDILLFEADPAMIVHSMDPIDQFPFKRQAAEAIYAAFETLLAHRQAGQS